MYGAALEALESTSNEQQEGLNREDEDVDTQKVEASATATDVIDDSEPVLVARGGNRRSGHKFYFMMNQIDQSCSW